MRFILADDVDLVASAGRKLWMLGFSSNQTRILNPIEVFLYVERFTDNARERLTLVRVSASGNIIPVIEFDQCEGGCDDGTIIFLANTEVDLFLIPEVAKIQSLLSDVVQEALQYRIYRGMGQESLFFDVDDSCGTTK